VNRAGWASGNDMAFIIKKDSGSGKRRMWSYNGNAGAAAVLHVQVQWNAGSGSSAPTTTVRQLLKQTVDNIQYKSGTPIVGTMYEAARYYRGEALEFGDQRGGSGTSRREHTRVSHPATYTGGTLNQTGSCTNDNLSHTDCRTENISDSPVYTSPINATCQESFIILLSDGSPSVNNAKPQVMQMIGADVCAGSGSGECGPELAEFLRDNDQIADATLQGTQRVTTHTIGFVDVGSSAWLTSVADSGGGNFYPAANAAALVTAFNTILASIADKDTTFVAPGATVNAFNRLNHRNDIFFSVFKPDEKYRWTGNLKKYQILNGEIADANDLAAVDPITGFFKDTAKSYWSGAADGKDVGAGGAAEKITATARNVYTYTGDYNTIPSGGVSINSGHDVDESNTSILEDANNDGDLDDAGDTNLIGANDPTEGENILKWARGIDVNDENEDGSSTDDRQAIGDPLHSVPEIITYGGTDAAPEMVVFVATNEGYLHAIVGGSALTTITDIPSAALPGHEIFSFVPKELLPNLSKFYRNTPTGDRPNGLDGEITSWVIESNNDADQKIEPLEGDKVYLYVGMRRGGKKYYALDVTDLTTPKLMWVFEDDTSSATDAASELGQSWSKPIKTRIRIDVSGSSTKKDVIIFGGGYDTANDDVGATGSPPTRTADTIGRAIYIVDALTGDLIWSGGINNGTVLHDDYFSDMNHSIPSDLRVIDINGDSIADFFYASDTGGQIWRFDINNGNAPGTGLVTGGVMANLSVDSSGPNNRRLYYEADASLLGSGSGQFIALAVGSGWRSHPLDEVVNDRLYMIRDNAIYGPPLGYGKLSGGSYTPITESDLYDATSNDLGQATGQDLIDARNLFATKAGWYIQLENTGEKALAHATTFQGQTFFTTYEPTASLQTCTAALGIGRLYVVNTADATPENNYYDPTNTTPEDLTKEDRAHTLDKGGIPPAFTILFPDDGSGGSLDPIGLIATEGVDIFSGRMMDHWYWLEREME
ncbi:Type IV fimbrial biogenesis protein PilY1, partial [hydrothermal vent metagenome]